MDIFKEMFDALALNRQVGALTTKNNHGPMASTSVGANFQVKKVPGGCFVVEDVGPAPQQQPQQQQPPLEIHKMTWAQWGAFATLMTDELVSFPVADYRLVKKYPIWRQVHGVKPRAVRVYDKSAGCDVEAMTEEATHCKGCYLVLPLANLEVDHRRPVAGGAPSALFKLMRAASFTKDPSRGKKGIILPSVFPNEASQINQIQYKVDPKVPPTGDLNWSGVILYTVAAASGYLSKLQTKALYHFVNLQPLCGNCNRVKSDTTPPWKFQSFSPLSGEKKRKM